MCRISPISDDWVVKGCHLHVGKVEVVLRPDLLRTRPVAITVDCSDDVTRGATVVTPAAPGAWTEIAVDAAERDIVDLIVRRVADYSW